jgi:hypothetical protein
MLSLALRPLTDSNATVAAVQQPSAAPTAPPTTPDEESDPGDGVRIIRFGVEGKRN